MKLRALHKLIVILIVAAFGVVGCSPEQVEVVVTSVVREIETQVVEVTRIVEGESIVTTVVAEVEVTRVVQVTPEAPAPSQETDAGDAGRAEQLNIAIGGPIADPTNLNLYAPGVSRSGTGLHQMIYEYLFYNNLQTGEFIPWLATDFSYNEDSTALTVNLRDGATWSDGEAFNADDVVFTYELLRDNPGMTWAAEVNDWVDSVEKVDDLTVTINLKSANPRFHLIREAFPAVGIWGGLTILPQHVWEGQDPLTFKSNPPIGTGAYELVNASQNVMSYERRDDWWGTEVWGVTPGPRFVNFQYVGPSTSVALALANDELDTPNIGTLSLADFLAVKERNQNLTAWTNEAPYAWLDPCPRALMVQNAHEPWNQSDARWALSYLIDRDKVVELAYEGTTTPAWGVWPAYDGLNPFFDDIASLRDQYQTNLFDPALAEERFGAAGITKDADGNYQTASGELLSVVYLVNADNSEEMRVATIVADQLEAQGIQVELQPLSGGVLNSAILVGDYDIKFHPFCPGFIYDNLELFHGRFSEPLGEPAPWYERNSFRYANAEFDAIVDEMAQVAPEDTAALVPLYADAMQIWFADLPVIPMVQAPALVPFNTAYWEGWPSADDPWNMPVSWWATFNLVINGYPDPATGEWIGGLRQASD